MVTVNLLGFSRLCNLWFISYLRFFGLKSGFSVLSVPLW